MRHIDKFALELATLVIAVFCWLTIFFLASCTSAEPQKLANHPELIDRQAVEDTSAVIVQKDQERHQQRP